MDRPATAKLAPDRSSRHALEERCGFLHEACPHRLSLFNGGPARGGRDESRTRVCAGEIGNRLHLTETLVHKHATQRDVVVLEGIELPELRLMHRRGRHGAPRRGDDLDERIGRRSGDRGGSSRFGSDDAKLNLPEWRCTAGLCRRECRLYRLGVPQGVLVALRRIHGLEHQASTRGQLVTLLDIHDEMHAVLRAGDGDVEPRQIVQEPASALIALDEREFRHPDTNGLIHERCHHVRWSGRIERKHAPARRGRTPVAVEPHEHDLVELKTLRRVHRHHPNLVRRSGARLLGFDRDEEVAEARQRIMGELVRNGDDARGARAVALRDPLRLEEGERGPQVPGEPAVGDLAATCRREAGCSPRSRIRRAVRLAPFEPAMLGEQAVRDNEVRDSVGGRVDEAHEGEHRDDRW